MPEIKKIYRIERDLLTGFNRVDEMKLKKRSNKSGKDFPQQQRPLNTACLPGTTLYTDLHSYRWLYPAASVV